MEFHYLYFQDQKYYYYRPTAKNETVPEVSAERCGYVTRPRPFRTAAYNILYVCNICISLHNQLKGRIISCYEGWPRLA